MYLLKVGYDPEFRAYSPGQLITARLIEYGMSQGMRRLDFLGAEMTWKRDWCDQVQPNCRLWLFAPTWRGRLAYGARFAWKVAYRRWFDGLENGLLRSSRPGAPRSTSATRPFSSVTPA